MTSPARKGSSACEESKGQTSDLGRPWNPTPQHGASSVGSHLHIHVGGVLPRVVVECRHHRSGGFRGSRMDQLRRTCRGRKEAPDLFHTLSSTRKPCGHHPQTPPPLHCPHLKSAVCLSHLSPDTLAQRWLLTWTELCRIFQLHCGEKVPLSPACLSLLVPGWGGAGQTDSSPSREGPRGRDTQNISTSLWFSTELGPREATCFRVHRATATPHWSW